MGLYSGTVGIDFDAISAVMAPVEEGWFNGTITIEDPDISGGTFDRLENETTGRTVTDLWTGKARIQAMRWPNVATTRQEAVSVRTVVFHLPLDTDLDPLLVREGLRVRVEDGGLSPHLEKGIYVITSSINSSYAWDRRIEAMMDQGSEAS